MRIHCTYSAVSPLFGYVCRRYSEATTDRSSSPSGRESTLGSVTFSMPFTGPLSSNTAPSGAPGSTWTNTSPFASGSGPSSDTSLSTGLSPNNVDPALGGPTSWASEHERSYDSATSVASHHGHAANAGWFQPFDQAPPPPMGAHSFGPEVEVEDSQPRFIRSLQHGAQHGQ